MRQQYRVDGFRRHRKFEPITVTQQFVALKQAAIDQQALPAGINNVSGTGHRSGRAEKLQRRLSVMFQSRTSQWWLSDFAAYSDNRDEFFNHAYTWHRPSGTLDGLQFLPRIHLPI